MTLEDVYVILKESCTGVGTFTLSRVERSRLLSDIVTIIRPYQLTIIKSLYYRYKVLGRYTTRSDLFQVSYVGIIEFINRFDPEWTVDDFQNLLKAAAYYSMRKHITEAFRYANKHSPMPDLFEDFIEDKDQNPPEDDWSKAECEDRIKECLKELTPEDRSILEQLFYQDKAAYHVEINSSGQLAAQNGWYYKNRALAALKEVILSRYGEDALDDFYLILVGEKNAKKL